MNKNLSWKLTVIIGILLVFLFGVFGVPKEMCIRDRRTTVAWSVSMAASPAPSLSPAPVSYTHLDVYKRQVLLSPTHHRKGGPNLKMPI